MNFKKSLLVMLSGALLMGSLVGLEAHASGIVPRSSSKPAKFGKFVAHYPKWMRGTWYTMNDGQLEKDVFTKNTITRYDGDTKLGTFELHQYKEGLKGDKTHRWNYAELGTPANLNQLYYINKKRDTAKIPYQSPVLIVNGWEMKKGYEMIYSAHQYGSNKVLTAQYGIDYMVKTHYYRTAELAKQFAHKQYPGFK